MPKFTFVGDPLDNFSGPNRITVAGEEFVKNKAKDVDNEDAVTKLRRNTHFREGEVDFDKLGIEHGDDADDDNDGDPYENVSNDHLRDLLNARGKSDDFKSNTSRKDLIEMVKESGGLD